MTQNLLSLQSTASLLELTQARLASGKKVNSSIDDPVAYFDAQAHYQLADDYAAFKDGMSEAVQTIKAATNTIDSLKDLLSQMKSTITSAKTSTSSTDATEYRSQYNTLLEQLESLAGDGEYKGVNLLGGDTLNVVFNTEGDELNVVGFNADITSLALASTQSAGAFWVTGAATQESGISANVLTGLNDIIDKIDDAIGTLRAKAKVLSGNLGIVTTRQEFTNEMIATLNTGGDNLTLADMNQEGANMLMLQTRQAMGIQSLSIASQSAQQVLQLFG
jgi:flagellin-like hook-associated protein FlgL